MGYKVEFCQDNESMSSYWCNARLAFPETSVYPEQAGEMREG